jgi:hypothetical protein
VLSFFANETPRRSTSSLATVDTPLHSLIIDYRNAVYRAALKLRRGGISMPISNFVWATSRMPAAGTLPSGATYRAHGYGCKVFMEEGEIDLDFGDKGEINGFDAWRLWRFAEPRTDKYGVTSHMELRAMLDSFHAQGALTKESEGSLYYFVDDC